MTYAQILSHPVTRIVRTFVRRTMMVCAVILAVTFVTTISADVGPLGTEAQPAVHAASARRQTARIRALIGGILAGARVFRPGGNHGLPNRRKRLPRSFLEGLPEGRGIGMLPISFDLAPAARAAQPSLSSLVPSRPCSSSWMVHSARSIKSAIRASCAPGAQKAEEA